MPYFLYSARDKTGNKITGKEEANNSDELVESLQKRGIIVISIKQELESSKKSALAKSKSIRHGRITFQDLLLLCQQLAILLEAGVPLLQSIKIITKQSASQRLNRVLEEIILDMEGGLSLHGAMAKHPKVFSELWINLVESGEASGNLAQVLKQLSDYLQREAQFKRKIITSLIYPAILVLAGIAAFFVLTTIVIPTFASLFEGFNTKLPPVTQALIIGSKFIRRYFIFGTLGLVIFIFLFRQFLNTKEGRKKWEKFLFSFPLTGNFFHALMIERFSSNLNILLESGVPIIYALEIVERSIANLTMAEVIFQIKEEVRAGKGLSMPLERSGFFEPIVVQLVAVGEEIGELPAMLKRINNFYQEYVDIFLTRFMALFEPIILIFMAIGIVFMLLGIYLPMFKIGQLH